MYVGGPLDTAPATPSSTLSRSQASHREVKVRKVNPSHFGESFVLEYRKVAGLVPGQSVSSPKGNYPHLTFLATFVHPPPLILPCRHNMYKLLLAQLFFLHSYHRRAGYEPNFKLNAIVE